MSMLCSYHPLEKCYVIHPPLQETNTHDDTTMPPRLLLQETNTHDDGGMDAWP
jgi:hypothetical protein